MLLVTSVSWEAGGGNSRVGRWISLPVNCSASRADISNRSRGESHAGRENLRPTSFCHKLLGSLRTAFIASFEALATR
jgi:hypothetical protein